MFLKQLKDYCANCTLAGLKYIANDKLHLVERLFWFLSVVLSGIGSYYIINQYVNRIREDAVSVVYESIDDTKHISFPTIAVCDLFNKYSVNVGLEKYVAGLAPCGMNCYNYDVEMFMNYLIYPYFYHAGLFRARCSSSFSNCDKNCSKCPNENYRQLHNKFSVSCNDLFLECSFGERKFNCCQYFHRLITPFGQCFLLNSLQNNNRSSDSWLPVNIVFGRNEDKMFISTTRPIKINILNPEEIPHTFMPTTTFDVNYKGNIKRIKFQSYAIINDKEVRDMTFLQRGCRFPDELYSDTAFKVISLNSCITDCLRNYQLKSCNCTSFALMPEPMTKYPECNLQGLFCLEQNNLIKIDAKLLLPWAQNGYDCNCLPSCTDNEYWIIYESQPEPIDDSNAYQVEMRIGQLPTHCFRRQALRTRLDDVVFIGGILGLFLGASILSGLEIIYYFTLRWWNNRLIPKTVY